MVVIASVSKRRMAEHENSRSSRERNRSAAGAGTSDSAIALTPNGAPARQLSSRLCAYLIAEGPRRDLRRQVAGTTGDARIALLLGAVYGRVKARREDPSHPVVLDGGGPMRALTVVKVSGDIDRFRQALLDRGDEFAKIAEEAKSKGALHHRFGIGDGFVLVVDEWQDADVFMQFFSNPEL